MKKYKIKIEPEALADILDITNWYNKAQAKLGKRFHDTTIAKINRLSKDPQIFAVRYQEIRCMQVTKFPYLVHFYINEENNTVEVLAVISTNRNPKIWDEKTETHI
jgi:plasmid stabilization system protein ParE